MLGHLGPFKAMNMSICGKNHSVLPSGVICGKPSDFSIIPLFNKLYDIFDIGGGISCFTDSEKVNRLKGVLEVRDRLTCWTYCFFRRKDHTLPRRLWLQNQSAGRDCARLKGRSFEAGCEQLQRADPREAS